MRPDTSPESRNESYPHQVKLASDDVLFFLHIPKTAGLSLMDFLEGQFHQREVFPLHSAPSPELFAPYTPRNVKQYRFVRGHFLYGPEDDGIYRHVVKHPVMITMLREPVARTVSMYRHNKRHDHGRWHGVVTAQNMSLHDWAVSPDTYDAVWNHQTRMLAGHIKGLPMRDSDPDALPDDVLLQLAKEKLGQCAAFGLTERFQESMQLLCYTFGWNLPDEYPQLNVSPEPTRVEDIDEDVLAIIRERTQLDAALYEYAQAMFQDRYQQMLGLLLHKDYQRSEPPLRAAFGAALNRASIRGRLHRAAFILRHRLFPIGTKREAVYLRIRKRILGR